MVAMHCRVYQVGRINARRGGGGGGVDSHIKLTWVIIVPFWGENSRFGTP